MEVIPNIGIGPVRFGMTPAEVIANFPDGQKYEDWMGGNRNDSLLFHGLILGFDSCDGDGPLADSRLVEFTIYGREDVRLWGQGLGDWSKEAVAEYLRRHGIPYEIHENGDWSVRPHSLAISFAEEGHIDWVEAWANLVPKAPAAKTGVGRIISFLSGRA
jgi:hypothetical protein